MMSKKNQEMKWKLLYGKDNAVHGWIEIRDYLYILDFKN